jgi:hypothetical protein
LTRIFHVLLLLGIFNLLSVLGIFNLFSVLGIFNLFSGIPASSPVLMDIGCDYPYDHPAVNETNCLLLRLSFVLAFLYKLAGVPGVARDDQWRNLLACFP